MQRTYEQIVAECAKATMDAFGDHQNMDCDHDREALTMFGKNPEAFDADVAAAIMSIIDPA